MGKGVLPLSSLQFRHFRGPNHQPDLPHHGFRHPGPDGPKLCIVMIGTNNTGYFKGGEAPEKTAMGIPVPLNTCWSGFRTPTSSCWAFSRAAQAPRTSCASTTTASTPFWPSASCPAPLTPTSTGAFWTPPANCSPASAGTTCTLRKKATPSGRTPCCPISKNTANSILSHPQRMTVGMPPSASHACGSGTYLSINDEAYAATTVQPSFLKLRSWSLKSTAHVHQFIFPGGSALNAYE